MQMCCGPFKSVLARESFLLRAEPEMRSDHRSHMPAILLRCAGHACRGYFSVNGSLANADGVFPDTYLNVGKFNWAKGVAFINGFNLVSLRVSLSFSGQTPIVTAP